MGSGLLEALAGAVDGLVGALVGGLIAFLTLWTQLRHEAKKEERNRKLTIRRDVYLEAVEAIGKSQSYLGSFSRKDYDAGKLLDRVGDLSGLLSKAQLVASEATFEALDRFGDFTVSSLIHLLSMRIEMDLAKRKLAEGNEQILQMEKSCAYMQEVLQGISPDVPRHAQLSSELLSHQREISVVRANLQVLAKENGETVERLERAAAKSSLLTQIEAGRIIMHMRREIELSLNEEWYLDQIRNRTRLLQDAFKVPEAPSESANPAPQADG